MQIAICSECPLISAWRIPFSISCKIGLLGTSSLVVHLEMSLSLWKSILPDVEILVDRFFFLSALWIDDPTTSFQRLRILMLKLVILLRVTYVVSHFSLVAFKRLILVCLYIDLHNFVLLEFMVLLECTVFSHQMWGTHGGFDNPLNSALARILCFCTCFYLHAGMEK